MERAALAMLMVMIIAAVPMSGCTDNGSDNASKVKMSLTMLHGTDCIGKPGESANFTLVLSLSPAWTVDFKVLGVTGDWLVLGSNMSVKGKVDTHRMDFRVVIPANATASSVFPDGSTGNSTNFTYQKATLKYKYSLSNGPKGEGEIDIRVYVDPTGEHLADYYRYASPQKVKEVEFEA